MITRKAKYNCDFCNERQQSLIKLRTHKRRFHLREGSLCPLCCSIFSNATFSKHLAACKKKMKESETEPDYKTDDSTLKVQPRLPQLPISGIEVDWSSLLARAIVKTTTAKAMSPDNSDNQSVMDTGEDEPSIIPDDDASSGIRKSKRKSVSFRANVSRKSKRKRKSTKFVILSDDESSTDEDTNSENTVLLNGVTTSPEVKLCLKRLSIVLDKSEIPSTMLETKQAEPCDDICAQPTEVETLPKLTDNETSTSENVTLKRADDAPFTEQGMSSDESHSIPNTRENATLERPDGSSSIEKASPSSEPHNISNTDENNSEEPNETNEQPLNEKTDGTSIYSNDSDNGMELQSITSLDSDDDTSNAHDCSSVRRGREQKTKAISRIRKTLVIDNNENDSDFEVEISDESSSESTECSVASTSTTLMSDSHDSDCSDAESEDSIPANRFLSIRGINKLSSQNEPKYQFAPFAGLFLCYVIDPKNDDLAPKFPSASALPSISEKSNLSILNCSFSNVCEICGLLSTLPLQRHKSSVHGKEKNVQCCYCGDWLPPSLYLLHALVLCPDQPDRAIDAASIRETCKLCKPHLELRNPFILFYHAIAVHSLEINNKAKRFMCPECGGTFLDYFLEIHSKLCRFAASKNTSLASMALYTSSAKQVTAIIRNLVNATSKTKRNKTHLNSHLVEKKGVESTLQDAFKQKSPSENVETIDLESDDSSGDVTYIQTTINTDLYKKQILKISSQLNLSPKELSTRKTRKYTAYPDQLTVGDISVTKIPEQTVAQKLRKPMKILSDGIEVQENGICKEFPALFLYNIFEPQSPPSLSDVEHDEMDDQNGYENSQSEEEELVSLDINSQSASSRQKSEKNPDTDILNKEGNQLKIPNVEMSLLTKEDSLNTAERLTDDVKIATLGEGEKSSSKAESNSLQNSVTSTTVDMLSPEVSQDGNTGEDNLFITVNQIDGLQSTIEDNVSSENDPHTHLLADATLNGQNNDATSEAERTQPTMVNGVTREAALLEEVSAHKISDETPNMEVDVVLHSQEKTDNASNDEIETVPKSVPNAMKNDTNLSESVIEKGASVDETIPVGNDEATLEKEKVMELDQQMDGMQVNRAVGNVSAGDVPNGNVDNADITQSVEPSHSNRSLGVPLADPSTSGGAETNITSAGGVTVAINQGSISINESEVTHNDTKATGSSNGAEKVDATNSTCLSTDKCNVLDIEKYVKKYGDFTCEFCGKDTNKMNSLANHKRRNHKDGMRCPLCMSAIPKSLLHCHRRIFCPNLHGQVNWNIKCLLCDAEQKTPFHLLRHALTSHSDNITTSREQKRTINEPERKRCEHCAAPVRPLFFDCHQEMCLRKLRYEMKARPNNKTATTAEDDRLSSIPKLPSFPPYRPRVSRGRLVPEKKRKVIISSSKFSVLDVTESQCDAGKDSEKDQTPNHPDDDEKQRTCEHPNGNENSQAPDNPNGSENSQAPDHPNVSENSQAPDHPNGSDSSRTTVHNASSGVPQNTSISEPEENIDWLVEEMLVNQGKVTSSADETNDHHTQYDCHTDNVHPLRCDTPQFCNATNGEFGVNDGFKNDTNDEHRPLLPPPSSTPAYDAPFTEDDLPDVGSIESPIKLRELSPLETSPPRRLTRSSTRQSAQGVQPFAMTCADMSVDLDASILEPTASDEAMLEDISEVLEAVLREENVQTNL